MRYFLILTSLLLGSCGAGAGTDDFTGDFLGGRLGGLSCKGEGRLIVSAAGLVAGCLTGAVLDEQDRFIIDKNSPRTIDRMDRGDPLTINDIIKLTQHGVSDITILEYIGKSLSIYSLSKTQIRRMQHSGVSQRVINAMIESGR